MTNPNGTSPAISGAGISGNGETLSQATKALLILIPVLILGSRVSSDITASLSALFLAYFWFKHPGHEIRQQAWFKVFLLLWLFMLVVTTPFSADLKYSLEQSLIAIRWPAMALVFSCIVFRSEARLRLFERTALVIFLFIAVDSIIQYIFGRDILGHVSPIPTRLTGPYTKVMPGSYGLRIYPMALVAMLYAARDLPKPRFIALVMAMVAFSQAFAFLTGERIVFLLFGMVNAVLILALIFKEKLSYRFILSALGGAVALVVAGALLAPKMFARTIESFFQQLADFQHSSYYQVFHTAIVVWRESPVIGVGTRYFNKACEALPVAMHPDEGCEVHPHNIYLEWLSQNGIIGLCLFLLCLFMIFRTLKRGLEFKAQPLQSAVVFVSLVMVFWPLTSSMSMQTNNYAGLVWLLVGWALARALHSGRSVAASA